MYEFKEVAGEKYRLQCPKFIKINKEI